MRDYIALLEDRYIALLEERIKAHPRRVVAATIAAIVASVVLAGLSNPLISSNEPSLQMISVDTLVAATEGAYYAVGVAVNNAGTATAERCYAKAYNHLLFSDDIAETSELGRSEQFDLSPDGGHVATVRVYLPDLSGEALLGGGVRAPVAFRTDCKNAESSDESRTITVRSPLSGSQTP
jgi:hypothetical protein